MRILPLCYCCKPAILTVLPSGTYKKLYDDLRTIGVEEILKPVKHDHWMNWLLDWAAKHGLKSPMTLDAKSDKEKGKVMIKNPGGIDLKADKLNLDIRSDDAPIQFNVDPAQLKDIQFDGLIPNIIAITPVSDLTLFLSGDKSPSSTGQLSMAN